MQPEIDTLFSKIKVGGLELDLTNQTNIYTAVSFNETQDEIFGVRRPSRKQLFTVNESLNLGCMCDEITFCPHTHCTHIESMAHVKKGVLSTLNQVLKLPPILLACLIKATTNCDGVICQKEVEAALAPFRDTHFRALIVFTRDKDSHCGKFASVPVSLANYLVNAFPTLDIILIDSPSIDPECDGGLLTAHRTFFEAKNTFFVVELCKIPAHINNGLYGLALNIAGFEETDAIPCRPVIYPLKECSYEKDTKVLEYLNSPL